MIEHGDINTARSLLIASIKMINKAGMSVSILNPGRLMPIIDIDTDTIEEADFEVTASNGGQK